MNKALTFILCIVWTGLSAQGQNLSNELHPSWSPNNQDLVFYSNASGNDDLYIISTTTSTKRKLTSGGNNENPVWSPSGEYIAFQSDRYGDWDIFIIRPDGSGLKRLTTNPQRDMSPGWSPDSQQIVYEVDTAGNWQLFSVDVVSGEIRQLTNANRDHLGTSWTNDGKEILYGDSYRGAHQTDMELHYLDPRNGAKRAITSNTVVSANPSFSPASDRVIFNTIRDGNWEIYVMDADGSNPERLTKSEVKLPDFEFSDIDGQPSFSFDGNKIAFLSGRSGSFDICVMDVQGKGFKNYTSEWRVEVSDD